MKTLNSGPPESLPLQTPVAHHNLANQPAVRWNVLQLHPLLRLNNKSRFGAYLVQILGSWGSR